MSLCRLNMQNEKHDAVKVRMRPCVVNLLRFAEAISDDDFTQVRETLTERVPAAQSRGD